MGKTDGIITDFSFIRARPELNFLIADYCGEKIIEDIGKKNFRFKTNGIWIDSGINPPYDFKVLIELLHLAYIKGCQD